MAQIPLINGVYADAAPHFRSAYPRNYFAVPKDNGIARGYLQPANGIVQVAATSGPDRGGYNWNDVCYRVVGTDLKTVAANYAMSASLGTVIGSTKVSMDAGFDRLVVVGGGNAYYYTKAGVFSQVTDADLGLVIDVVWVDSYFVFTDGSVLIVADLTDPTAVNPLKYGSAEFDPDSIVGVCRVGTELTAVGRYSVQAYTNVGGTGFPFSPIKGTIVNKGAFGTHSFAALDNTLYMVGSGRNEAPSVWQVTNGSVANISTSEIDKVLKTYTPTQLAAIEVEMWVDEGHMVMMIHCPDRTLALDISATLAAGEPVWAILTSGMGINKYRCRNLTWCYNKWIVGDTNSNAIGIYDNTISTHWGQALDWEFGTVIVYLNGKGAIMYDMELVGLYGQVPLGANPVVLTSYTKDGVTWSQEMSVRAGKQGQRTGRLCWINAGSIENFRAQKFRGTSDCHVAFARLEARFEPLYV